MEEDRDNFLSLFKHNSAIDPRAATANSVDSSDEEVETYKLGSTTKRKRGAKASVKRSKSDLNTSSTQSKKRATTPAMNTIDIDDVDSVDAVNTDEPHIADSPSELPSYLANAMQRVNDNKKLRAQLKESATDLSTTGPTTRSALSQSRDKPSKPSVKSNPPVVFTIDDDDDDGASPSSNSSNKTANSKKTNNNNNNNNNKTSNGRSANTDNDTPQSDSVLFSVLAHEDDKPAKFRYFKSHDFTKLFQAYCNLKKYDLNNAGFKWYGWSLDPTRNALSYEMTDEETLYYYDKTTQDASTTSKLSTSSSSTSTSPPTLTTSTSSATIDVDDDNTHASTSTSAPADDKPATDVIVLKLQEAEGDRAAQKFRIRKTDTFKKLIDGYADKRNIPAHLITLVFDGLPLPVNSTPEDQDMDNQDIIDVKIAHK